MSASAPPAGRSRAGGGRAMEDGGLYQRGDRRQTRLRCTLCEAQAALDSRPVAKGTGRMSDSSLRDNAALPPTLARHVDRICNAFELAWRGTSRPQIEDFIGGVPEPERFALLRELLLLEVEYRRARGEECRTEDY